MAKPILSVEKFSMTMADSVGTVTANLAAAVVTNLSPRVSFRNTLGTQESFTDIMLNVEFLTGPNRVQLTRGFTDGAIEAEVSVTEWDTGEVTLQTGTYTYAEGTGTTATVTAVDLDKTFVTCGQTSTQFPATTLAANLVRWQMTATTTLTFVSGAAGGTNAGDWFLVEDDGDNFDVQRVLALSMGGASADATITSIATDRTQVMCSQAQTDVGTGNADDMAIGFLNSDTVFRTTRVDTEGTTTTDAFIITFTTASFVNIRRGTITLGSGTDSGTENHTAVVLANSYVHCPMAVPTASSDGAFRQSAFAAVSQNSATQVQADGNDNTSVEIVPWEVLEFILDDPALFFGTNF